MSPDNSASSFGLKIESVDFSDPEGGTKIEVDLIRSPYPPDARDTFLPQRFPDRCRVRGSGPLTQVLRRGVVSFTVWFRPGTHEIPLGEGPPCIMEHHKGARCRGRVEIGPGGMGGEPVVKSVDLTFTPALSIHNVMQTLGQFRELVADRRLAPLRGIFEAVVAPRLPSWLREIPDHALGRADTAAEVLLERATARIRHRADPTLPFSFTGRVRWVDQVETRFEDLRLPGPVLPIPYASLERLLSDTPLSSTIIVGEQDDAFVLARRALATVEVVEADLSLQLEPPSLQLRGSTIDGTVVETRILKSPERYEVRGSLEAEVEGEHIALRSDDLRLEEVGRQGTELSAQLTAALDLDLTPEADRALSERIALDLQATVLPGSRLRKLEAEVRTRESLSMGTAEIPLELSDLELGGGFHATYDGHGLEVRPTSEVALRCEVSSPRPALIRNARQEWFADLEATLSGKITPSPEGRWTVEGSLDAGFKNRLLTTITALPELDIDDGLLKSQLDGQLEASLSCALELYPGNRFQADLSGTRFGVTLERGELRLQKRRVMIPEGTGMRGRVLTGLLTAGGPRDIALDLSWDLHGQRFLLHHQGEVTSLLTPDLRAGQVTLTLDRTGRLRFEGDRGGLYGVRYFNALLNPMSDLDELLDLLESDDAINRVVAAIGAFAPRVAETLADLRALILGARYIFRQEGISEPRHMVPREAIARILSLLLTGDLSEQPRLTPIVKRVTDAEGLDLRATRALLHEHLDDFDIDYEIGVALNWLDLVLSPSEPVDPPPAEVEQPLATDPRWAEAREGLPSAAEIYQALETGGEGEVSPGARLAELAPRLSLDQLTHIMARVDETWDPAAVSRLSYVHELKARVADIAEGYGGPEYGMQPFAIGSFLGEAIGPLQGIERLEGSGPNAWPPACALGPEEIAVLLQAGQSTGKEDKRSQINNRMIMELLRREPPEFTAEVFVELGHQNPRALSGILYSFLDQDQDQMATELNLVELLSDKLGLAIPRQRDYMAGGRRAKDSYWDALQRVADQIIHQARPYLAAKHHLQVARHDPPPALALSGSAERLERKAIESIQKADDWGHRCTFDNDQRGGPRAKARQAYGRAFRACARLLRKEPRAICLPWVKEFWLRNEEALMVLSVVRNHQQDIDQDRRWLQVMTGGQEISGEQDLLRTAIDTLYWREEHQQAMLADPLTRLLMDPEPGRYDFSIISCMGVITDGKDGKELEGAYGRLEQQRGVRVIRANTGLSRSLEYNADRIIEAIESCETPWGIIGYSQGCTNALMAESTLRGGTPDRQRLLDTMVCRNMLFSAINGSAHGTSGMLKFHRALVLGEKYMKRYQALMSWEAIQAVLKAVKMGLDSRAFVHIMGGVHSLTYERAKDFHRDGQFLAHVPTSLTRGVTAKEWVPETLEFLYHVLNKITSLGDQDTQVLIHDAIGSSTRVFNEQTEVLASCDMGAHPQSTHHWAPLTKEIEFVTTERDLEQAIYISPKDRLVWPWVEVNARFGRIERV